MTDQMICSACKKPKHQLKTRVSKLMPDANIYLCGECIAAKREPRGYVVMAGRRDGMDSVSFWLKPQRYVGDPITAHELLVD